MKINQGPKKGYESNIASQDEKVRINSSLIPFLFDNIYKDKIKSLVQEYMSNARDANREVGEKRKIEVILPSSIDPFFKVRDFGPGISKERMAKIFTEMGGSTKRHTNSLAGGIGIGSKSALSYQSAFDIITIVDGIKSFYTCWKDEYKEVHCSSYPDMAVETDEPNGTEIRVAVKESDIPAFQKAVYRCCAFWTEEEYPVIHGQANQEYFRYKEFLKVGDFDIIPSSQKTLLETIYSPLRKLFCVIDGIIYPMNDNLYFSINEVSKIEKMIPSYAFGVVHLNNGSVQVDLSREAFDDSILSKRTIMSSLTRHYDLLVKKREEFLSKVKTEQDLIEMIPLIKQSFGEWEIEAGELSSSSSIQGEIKYKPLEDVTMTLRKIGKRNSVTTQDVKLENMPYSPEHIFYDDGLDNSRKIQQKVRKFLNKSSRIIILSQHVWTENFDDHQELTVKSKEALENIIEKFNVKPISSLPEPIRGASNSSTTPRVRRSKEDLTFAVHRIEDSYGAAKIVIDLNNFSPTKTYVYVEFKDYNKNKASILSNVELLYQGLSNYSFIKIPHGMVKHISSNKHFVPYERFLTTDVKEASIASKLVGALLRSLDVNGTDFILNNYAKIKNKKISDIWDRYGANSGATYGSYYGYRDEARLKELLQDTKEFSQYLIDKEEYKNYLIKELPLLTLLKNFNTYNKTEQMVEDLIGYINLKGEKDV